jgi:cAMP-binding proteins - catabolite gene activator and regulatory subunit of cAMP-dependent protein kinases
MKATDENLLRRSSLFQFLPEEHFEQLRLLLQEENYEFGDLLVRQGEPADAFYVLVSGRARVVKADQNGNEIVLATLKPGDSFGEAALSEGGTRTPRCVVARRSRRCAWIAPISCNWPRKLPS